MFEARIILESNLAGLRQAAERGREEHYVLMAEEVAEMFGALTNPTDYLIHDVLGGCLRRPRAIRFLRRS